MDIEPERTEPRYGRLEFLRPTARELAGVNQVRAVKRLPPLTEEEYMEGLYEHTDPEQPAGESRLTGSDTGRNGSGERTAGTEGPAASDRGRFDKGDVSNE